jgi:hypothetical protein
MLINLLSRLSPLEQLTDLDLTVAEQDHWDELPES